MRRPDLRLGLGLVGAFAALLAASPAPGYVPNTIDFVGSPVIAHWSASEFPIPIRVTPGLTSDVNDGSERSALDSAMATWGAASDSTAAIYVEREQDVEANVLDGINAIQFSNSVDLDQAGFVSLTLLLTEADGRIVEADMLVNDRRFGFTTQAGSQIGLDLETVMLKELGKLLGLANSPLGARNFDGTIDEVSAVMFSVSRGITESARTLRDDDVAGIGAMYPASGSRRGAISGFVTRDGLPVFGAHVLAHDPIQDVLVSAVTLPDGSYEIAGLPEGRYLMEAVPLTGTGAGPATLGGIFTSDAVNTTFREAFFTQTVRLSAGQRVGGVSVEVQ